MSNCQNCHKPAQLQCGICKIPYCSDRCQGLNWTRHMWVCRKMPALEPIDMLFNPPTVEKETIPKSTFSVSERLNPNRHNSVSDDNKSIQSILITPTPRINKISYNPSLNAWLKCTLLDILPNGDVVVIEIEQKKKLETFSDALREFMLRSDAKNSGDRTLEVNDMVALVVNGKWQRGVVAAINSKTLTARIILKDFFSSVKTGFSTVFPLTSKFLTDAPVYSFKVRSEERMYSKKGDDVDLKVILKNPDGSFYVEWKTTSNVPNKILSLENALKAPTQFDILLRSDDGQKVLVKFNFPADAKWNPKCLPINDAAPEPTELELKDQGLVAANTKQGWRRAVVVQHYGNKNIFLVWLVDDGTMAFANKVKQLCGEFVAKPIGVALITFPKGETIPKIDHESYVKEGGSSDVFNLVSGSNTVAAKIEPFLGDLTQLDLSHWAEDIQDEEVVKIAHVVTYYEVFVTANYNSLYPAMLKEVASLCNPIHATETVGPNQLVLAKEPNDTFFRGMIVSHSIGSDKSLYHVQNVDSGALSTVSKANLYHPINTVRAMPCRVKKVNLQFLVSVRTDGPNRGLEILQNFCQEKKEFLLKYDKTHANTADLLYIEDKKSLCKDVLLLLFSPPLEKMEIEKQDEGQIEPLKDAPKQDFAKQVAPKNDSPKQAAPKHDVSKIDSLKQAAPKHEVAKIDSPKQAALKVDSPKQAAPKINSSNIDSPKQAAPKMDSPNMDSPKQAHAPKHDVPKIYSPKQAAPKHDVPKIDSPEQVSPKNVSKPSPIKTNDTDNTMVAWNPENIKKTILNPGKSKKYFLDDITVKPIEIGTDKCLFVLDVSSIKSSLIAVTTAAEDNLAYAQDVIMLINNFLKTNPQTGGYTPKENEVCLVPFALDGMYYRASFVQKGLDKDTYFFLDYGNTDQVDPSSVFPLPDCLTFPTVTNICYVENSESDREKLFDLVTKGNIVFPNCTVEAGTECQFKVKFNL